MNDFATLMQELEPKHALRAICNFESVHASWRARDYWTSKLVGGIPADGNSELLLELSETFLSFSDGVALTWRGCNVNDPWWPTLEQTCRKT